MLRSFYRVGGLDCDLFRRMTGYSPQRLFADILYQHEKEGLLYVEGGVIALSSRGRLVADTVIADFLSPRPPRSGKY